MPARPSTAALADSLPRDRAGTLPSSTRSRSQTSPASPIRIAIRTGNRLLDEGLRRILALDPSLLLIGKRDGRPALPAAGGDSADIVLADGMGAEPRRGGARPWVVLLGTDDDEESMLHVLKRGVRGILGKDSGVEELKQAIRLVHAGQIWARRSLLVRALDELAGLPRPPQTAELWPAQRLSAREQEIVRRVAEGLSNDEIAGRLGISEGTVKTHLTRIFQKLAVRGRTQLTALYHRTLARPEPR